MRITGLMTIAGVLLLVIVAIPLVRFMASSLSQLHSLSEENYVNVSESEVTTNNSLCPSGFYMVNITVSRNSTLGVVTDLKLYLTLFESNGSTLVYRAPATISGGKIMAYFCVPPGALSNATRVSLGFSGYIYGMYLVSVNETSTVSGDG